MLKEAKMAIPVAGCEWDAEVARLCKAAELDLTTRGVTLPGTVVFTFAEEAVVDPDSGETILNPETGEPLYRTKVTDLSTLDDPLCVQAICTYVKANLGNPPNRQWLKESYDEQKAQLMVTTNYTDFGENET